MALRDRSSQPDPEAGISMSQYQRIQARIKRERDLRLRQQDIAYRLALGLPLNEELPKQLGTGGGRHAGAAQRSLRGTKKPA